MPSILLIEDNEANQDLIARYLELFGHRMSVACDGLAGLERAHALSDQIDLILLDMNLPEIDGWEVARRLKQSETTRSIPLIAVTAHAMVGDREKTLAAGCDDYATKPIDFSVLLKQIETLVTQAT